MREYRIAAIPGDGIGIEVIAAGLKVLDVLAQRDRGFRLVVEDFPWSSGYYLEHGHYIPEGGLEQLRGFDAIFLARSARRTSPTTSRSGACGCRSARASTSTPTCGRRACCRASAARSRTARRSTG